MAAAVCSSNCTQKRLRVDVFNQLYSVKTVCVCVCELLAPPVLSKPPLDKQRLASDALTRAQTHQARLKVNGTRCGEQLLLMPSSRRKSR